MFTGTPLPVNKNKQKTPSIFIEQNKTEGHWSSSLLEIIRLCETESLTQMNDGTNYIATMNYFLQQIAYNL